MATNNDYKMPVFDGTSYSTWKSRLLLYLRGKKCAEATKRERIAANESQEVWEDKDLKAMNYICSALNKEQYELVKDENTAFKIMTKLDGLYLKSSLIQQIASTVKLENMKLKDFDDAKTFFMEFDKAVNEVKDAGQTLTEEEKLNYMWRTLPESMKFLRFVIDGQAKADQTCDSLKGKILLWEVENKSEKSSKKSSAFKIDKDKDRVCHKCGKKGHIQRNCRRT